MDVLFRSSRYFDAVICMDDAPPKPSPVPLQVQPKLSPYMLLPLCAFALLIQIAQHAANRWLWSAWESRRDRQSP